jgi:hypothetical protein
LVDHHWLRVGSDREFVPNLDKFGFVYIITNLRNGKAYIGCKQYLFYTRLREKESDWRTYTGSSKLLNEDIEKTGKKHFKFEAIAEYKNKRSLRYYELYYQMKYNVLTATLEGSEEHAYYNSRVGGKFYRPVESYQDPEYRKNLSKAMNNPEYRKKVSEAQKKRTDRQDPEYRKKMSKAQKKRYEDPEERRKTSEANKKKWEDPEERRRQSKAQKKRWEDPEEIRRQSEVQKKRFEDPEERRKTSEATKKGIAAKKRKKNAKAKET